MPCITELRSLFYPELSKIKVIPFNIYDLLTPAAVAHLIMGDGSAQRHGLIICTDSYTLKDVVRLINVLIIRYRLECSIRYHSPTQPRIYIKERSMPLLRTIVRPHMCSTMLYKLGNVVNARYQYTTSCQATNQGCFLVNIYNSPSSKLGKAVSLVFTITQHIRDYLLLTSFERYLDCGKYSDRSDKVKVPAEEISQFTNIQTL